MFQFTGYLLNKHFESTEAESPSDLYHLWKSDGDPPMDNLRCWVLLKTNVSSVWVDIVLDISAYFECIKMHFEGIISIEFREKNAPSPNISPESTQAKESDAGTVETIRLV